MAWVNNTCAPLVSAEGVWCVTLIAGLVCVSKTSPFTFLTLEGLAQLEYFPAQLYTQYLSTRFLQQGSQVVRARQKLPIFLKASPGVYTASLHCGWDNRVVIEPVISQLRFMVRRRRPMGETWEMSKYLSSSLFNHCCL